MESSIFKYRIFDYVVIGENNSFYKILKQLIMKKKLLQMVYKDHLL